MLIISTEPLPQKYDGKSLSLGEQGALYRVIRHHELSLHVKVSTEALIVGLRKTTEK